MLETLDIFRGPEFHASTLDRVADNITYVPQALDQLGIFNGLNSKGIRTTTVEVYMENGTIRLVPTTERGAPEPLPRRNTSEIVYLKTTRIAERDRIYSYEIQDILSDRIPLAQRLHSAQQEVNDRASILRSNNEMTMEFHRLGALQGKLLDADGTTVLRNYFTEFGVSEPAAVSVNFSTITANGIVEFFQSNFVRPMMRVLKTRKNAATRVAALVGDNFWAGLINHQGVVQTYLNTQQAYQLRQGVAPPWGQFDFAGITFINYMGTDDGTTIAIPTNDARFFPLNATDVFRVWWSPGERLRDVNQVGQPVYFIVSPDNRPNLEEWVDVRVRSYPLYACIFPGALMKATRTG
jgi:hypothetical protein